ncbi:hypothetical protein [Hymenobacter sp. B81]|uniref:hypothetical protein n=1 Tax=Hymenobacter sp. B81 TaxID=3344878 RepID=UPI0037DD1E6F
MDMTTALVRLLVGTHAIKVIIWDDPTTITRDRDAEPYTIPFGELSAHLDALEAQGIDVSEGRVFIEDASVTYPAAQQLLQRNATTAGTKKNH